MHFSITYPHILYNRYPVCSIFNCNAPKKKWSSVKGIQLSLTDIFCSFVLIPFLYHILILFICSLIVSLNMNQLWIATQIYHSQNTRQSKFFLLNFMSHTELWHRLSDRWKMSEWVISSCLDDWQSDTLWCGAFCKMLWQLLLSIVGFSSRLCGIIDLSSASSSNIPLLLLSRQQFIKHLHRFSIFFKVQIRNVKCGIFNTKVPDWI